MSNSMNIRAIVDSLAVAFGGHDQYSMRHVAEAISLQRIAGRLSGTNRELGMIADDILMEVTGADPESFIPYQVEEEMLPGPSLWGNLFEVRTGAYFREATEEEHGQAMKSDGTPQAIWIDRPVEYFIK